jgi:hypothetical protein
MSTALFVAGTRENFRRLASELGQWRDSSTAAKQLPSIENMRAFEPVDKVRSIPSEREEVLLEVVIQDVYDDVVLTQFQEYAESLGAKPDMRREHREGHLSFIPVSIHTDAEHSLEAAAEELAKFTFVRVARGMPRMRPIETSFFRSARPFAVTLPEEGPLNPDVHVAVFDGGISKGQVLDPWVSHYSVKSSGNPIPEGLAHGLGVTSALLFGPITPNSPLQRPYFHVDHYRVAGDAFDDDNENAYNDMLDCIVNVFNTFQGRYQFAVLCMGPDFAIDDDDVSKWTATLDKIFARDKILAAVAAGNDGDRNAEAGLNRIQPPGDGVNTLTVGAADSQGANWQRADYSCVGPGRSPGIVKPDGVAFGGSLQEPFLVIDDAQALTISGVAGTSFAAPYVMRAAAGISAVVGPDLSTLAIKALMVHQSNRGDRALTEVGWGRFETEVGRLITCNDNEALIVYQGELPIGQYLRCWLPVPDDEMSGMVTLSATLAIAPDTDPDHPSSYTRDGLEAAFRRDHTKYNIDKVTGKKSAHPKPTSFFSEANMYTPEHDLREGGHKWEPVLHHSASMRASGLNRPCFDLYYHNRDAGRARNEEEIQSIPYALIVSIKCVAVPDLYNKVIRAHAGILQQLKPTVSIQLNL